MSAGSLVQGSHRVPVPEWHAVRNSLRSYLHRSANADMGKGDVFDRAICYFTAPYADPKALCSEAFRDAIDSGALESSPGL